MTPAAKRYLELTDREIAWIYTSSEKTNSLAEAYGVTGWYIRKIRDGKDRTDVTAGLAQPLRDPVGFKEGWTKPERRAQLQSAQSEGAKRRWAAIKAARKPGQPPDYSIKSPKE